jgi:hypothetical protein
MDPFFVYLFGILAVYLIGWLWWEWRCAVDGWREAVRQRDRARDFAIALSEMYDHETGQEPLLAAVQPPRRAHLRSVD